MSITLRGCIIVTTVVGAAILTLAQEDGNGPQGPAEQRRGAPAQGMSDGAMLAMVRQMDANRDVLVDEQELNAAFAKLEKDAAQLYADLLAWLDRDKDGKLTPEEMAPFFNAMRMFQTVRTLDQNRDMNLQAKELDAAFAQLARFCQEYNDRLLGQYDKDGDGQLNDAEAKAAQERQQRWGRGGRRRGGN